VPPAVGEIASPTGERLWLVSIALFNQVPQEEEEEEAIEGCSQVSHLGQHTTGWESVTEVVVVGWLEKQSM